MKIIKVMSIIGMVFFPLCLVFVLAFGTTQPQAAAGWGMFATFYGIGFSIPTFVQANKRLREASS